MDSDTQALVTERLTMIEKAISPNELARRLAVKPSKVLKWIALGELKAVNLAERRGGRPRWKILPEYLDEFLASRASTPPPVARRRRRRPKPFKEYF